MSFLGRVLFGGIFLISACTSSRNEYAPPPPPKVTVKRPVRQMVTQYAEFTGTTKASEAVEIRARVEGYLAGIHFSPSASVKKGDLLFSIDPKPFEAKHRQAKADLDIRRAELDLAEVTLKRKERALRDRAVSELEVLDARAKRDKAKAAVTAAEAVLEAVDLELSYTRIVSPISGGISRSLVDVGNLVGAGGEKTLLTTVVNGDPMYVYFSANEDDLLKSRQEQFDRTGNIGPTDTDVPVLIGLAHQEGFPFEGRADFIENTLDIGTGTIQIRAVFPNSDHFLLPGLFCRVRLPIGRPKESLLVPESALGADQQGRYLYVVNEKNEVEYRPVQPGILVNGMRVIQSGVSLDDRIIVNGIQRARPGITVTPLESIPNTDKATPASS